MKKFKVTLEITANDTVQYDGVNGPIEVDVDHLWAYLDGAVAKLKDEDFAQ
jgi:hypothetical protein